MGLTAGNSRGCPPIPDIEIFRAFRWIGKTGSQWEFLPSDMPSRATCFRRLKTWREAEVFTVLLSQLLRPTTDQAIVDASFIRARSGGDGIGLTRHGKGLVLQVITDMDGDLIAARMQAAGPSERSMILSLVKELDLELPDELIADAGYDSNALADSLATLGCTLTARPSRSRKDYRERRDKTREKILKRWPVERLFAWLSGYRGVTTRYAKSLQNHAQATWLAFAEILFKRHGYSF